MVIDLKNAEVFFVDGNIMTGAVDFMTGYMEGATSIVVNGITGIIPVGSFITIDGVPLYEVTSTVETMGNTTTINFTPGLRGAVADDDVVTVDGQFLRIKVGDGTIAWTEKKPREFIMDRGTIDTVRNADEEPMDVNFSLQYNEITASTGDPPSPEDVLKRVGEAAAWVTSNTEDPCAPYCVDIWVVHTPPNCEAVEIEKVTLPRFYYEELAHDVKAGTIQCTGRCLATDAVAVRIAQ